MQENGPCREDASGRSVDAARCGDRMQDLSIFGLPPGFRGRSAVICQLWWIVEALFFRTSPQVMYGWRRFLLRLFGARIGQNVLLRPSVRVTYPWKLWVGDFAWIGDDVVLYTLGEISIGAHAVISQRSYICTGSHDYRKPSFDIYAKPVDVKRGAWIAADVFVAPGVTIGEETVVGARSSVFDSLPANVVALGSPARVVGARW